MHRLTLTEEPALREFEAAEVLDCSPRTIMRRRSEHLFPEPDYYEQWGKRKIPFWKLSTLRRYKASLRVPA